MPRPVPLNMVKMVHFVECIFHHNKSMHSQRKRSEELIRTTMWMNYKTLCCNLKQGHHAGFKTAPHNSRGLSQTVMGSQGQLPRGRPLYLELTGHC